jgi:enoyl-CoA hydratase
MGAKEAFDLGTVNRVVPRDELATATLELAREIAAMNPFGIALAKRAVNATMDAAGQREAMEHVFDIHWLGHSNALVATSNESAIMTDLAGMRDANKRQPTEPTK